MNFAGEIARTRKSDVLWVAFEYPNPGSVKRMPKRLRQHRSKIIFWLEQRKVYYEECFGAFDGALEEPYRGDLFVALPPLDRTNQDFIDLEAMLEQPDGSPSVPGCVLYHLPLKVARKNEPFYRKAMSDIGCHEPFA
jgi:hypothetical protein